MNYNLVYTGELFNRILHILNNEAPTWKWEVEFGYTPAFTHEQTEITLPMYGMNSSDLVDISKYNIREIAKGIARSASEIFLREAKKLRLEELDYRVDGASFTFHIGDIIWVKPKSEIWVEPDKYAVIFSNSMWIILQDKHGGLVTHLEPLTLTVFGREKLIHDFEWRDPLIKCPFCNEYVYVDWLYHLKHHRKEASYEE